MVENIKEIMVHGLKHNIISQFVNAVPIETLCALTIK